MRLGLPELPSWFSLVALERVDSTNEEALHRAHAGAPEGTLIWAREQSRGRGRRGRSWASPRGNLYASLLLRPGIGAQEASQIGFVVAVAVAEVLRPTIPAARRLQCKWPNDLLIDGAKLAGILPEAEVRGAMAEVVVVGIGVNVESFPEQLSYPATSLLAAGAGIGVAELLERLAPRLQAWYQRWGEEGFAPVRRRWLEFAARVGEPIRVRLEHELLDGRFAGLDANGALDIELPGGARRLVRAGDVSYPVG
jgi:BirA family transcriptional regulator, biotin operon repressor / biotin---[acetyl-CoA-carboxylase] ligase